MAPNIDNEKQNIRKSCRNHKGSNLIIVHKTRTSVKVKLQLENSKPPSILSSSMSVHKITKKKSKRPTPEECAYVTLSLAQLHPEVIDRNNVRRKTLLESCGMRESITDSIVSTMLSQNTTDANAKAAFSTLKERFPCWQNVLDRSNDIGKIEDAIKVAGLSKIRAERIVEMLAKVKEEQGVPSMDYIQHLTDEEIKIELSRFKGLGPKSISCVLLFALGRNEFPVDTHVLRIASKMGWVSSGMSREAAYEYLNEIVPNEWKLDLHCLLVQHGKICHDCSARNKPQFPPEDGSKLQCPLKLVPRWEGFVPPEYVSLPNYVHVKFDSNGTVKSEEVMGSVILPDKVLS